MAKNSAITESELFFDMQPGGAETQSQNNFLDNINGKSLKAIMAEIEKEVIELSLKNNRGKVAQTVEQLSIGKTAFYDKMKRYNISPKDHSF